MTVGMLWLHIYNKNHLDFPCRNERKTAARHAWFAWTNRTMYREARASRFFNSNVVRL